MSEPIFLCEQKPAELSYEYELITKRQPADVQETSYGDQEMLEACHQDLARIVDGQAALSNQLTFSDVLFYNFPLLTLLIPEAQAGEYLTASDVVDLSQGTAGSTQMYLPRTVPPLLLTGPTAPVPKLSAPTRFSFMKSLMKASDRGDKYYALACTIMETMEYDVCYDMPYNRLGSEKRAALREMWDNWLNHVLDHLNQGYSEAEAMALADQEIANSYSLYTPPKNTNISGTKSGTGTSTTSKTGSSGTTQPSSPSGGDSRSSADAKRERDAETTERSRESAAERSEKARKAAEERRQANESKPVPQKESAPPQQEEDDDMGPWPLECDTIPENEDEEPRETDCHMPKVEEGPVETN